MFEVVKFVEGSQGPGQDRTAIYRRDDTLVLVLADGVGERPGGAEAAEAFLVHVRSFLDSSARLDDGTAWRDLLADIDETLADEEAVGEATRLVVAVSAAGVVGAGVGDSVAWVVTPTGTIDFTAGLRHKPFLGDGAAWRVTFSLPTLSGTLLLASDGLWKYADAERLGDIVRERQSLERIAERLVTAVRLPTGALWDDVSLILCRPTG